jgi:microcystin degradation protein MlrC
MTSYADAWQAKAMSESSRPLKVFTAGLGVESNTFSAMDVDWPDFERTCLFRNGDHPGALTEVSAPLFILRERARAQEWIVVEGTYAFALPAGRTKTSVYKALRDEIIAQACAHAPYDFIALSLHGAMTAHGYDDCEGDLLARLRAALGLEALIGVELDPHAHLSQAMFDNADLIVAFKEYPHVDFLERGRELIAALERYARNGNRPHKAMFDCRTIGRFHTMREPMKGLVAQMVEAEAQGEIISGSFIHGFPWGDVADMGAKIIVYSDDVARAEVLAADFGAKLIAIREESFQAPAPLAAALAQALAAPPGLVTLGDISDNPGGGARGDDVTLLRLLMEAGVRSCLGPFWDPDAVALAHRAGLDSEIDIELGGEKLCLRAHVKALHDHHIQTWAKSEMALGSACVLTCGPVDVVVCSIRDQAYGPDLFTGMGLTLADYRIAAVKSAQHFTAGFAPVSIRIVLGSGGGPLQTDFRAIDYRCVCRPIWPLDAI